MTTVSIYSLTDPRNGAVRYIGKTRLDLSHRMRSHMSHEHTTAKGRWISKLKQIGLKPEIEIVDEVPEADWQFWEQYWISQFKAWGFTLLNGDFGGLGSNRLSIDTKRKISNKLKGTRNRCVSYSQYDLDGNLIQKFNSLAEAETQAKTNNVFRVSQNGKIAGGFQWRRDSDLKPVGKYTRTRRIAHEV